MEAAAAAIGSLGFLSVVESPQLGVFGGYLVVNAAGRPLEFHCTAPVKPNRAQEILYGPTLKPYLYGEQIGRTLLRRAKQATDIVWTDVQPVLAVRQHVEKPVVLVGGERLPGEGDASSPAAPQGDRAHAASLVCAEYNGLRLAVELPYRADLEAAIARLATLAVPLDLAEPFERIRQAIDEAGRSAA